MRTGVYAFLTLQLVRRMGFGGLTWTGKIDLSQYRTRVGFGVS